MEFEGIKFTVTTYKKKTDGIWGLPALMNVAFLEIYLRKVRYPFSELKYNPSVFRFGAPQLN